MSSMHPFPCVFLYSRCCRKTISLLARRQKDDYAADYLEDSLSSARENLHNNTLHWLEDLVRILPTLRHELKSISVAEPETAFLPLPSRLSAAKRKHYGLEYAQDIEYGIRKVQAHGILHEIRGLIIMQVDNVETKKNFIHGQNASTRAKTILQRFERDKKDAMERYNFVRDRLIVLGLSPDDTVLRKLEASHMRGKDATKVAQPGEARMGDSWLWSVSKPGGLTADEEAEWFVESECICYFWSLVF